MAITNSERVGKALDILKDGLRPYVERELRATYKDRWLETAKPSFPDWQQPGKDGKGLNWDSQAILQVMCDLWNDCFKKILGPSERNLAFELRDVRNKWAHQKAFSTDDAYRAIDSISRLLAAVSAEQVEAVEQMKAEILRVKFEEQLRTQKRKESSIAVEGKPATGLRPWREIVTPHPDVASGRYQQAEFAADLWQVYQGEGSDEYKHPTEFFRRTFITEGLRRLLDSALKRLAGVGGDPVVELQTNFGGGKSHTELSLWHAFSGTPASEMPGVEELVKQAGVPIASGVKRAVLVGNKISPGQPHKKPDGTVVRTLWGELAWQLGGKEGYAMLKEADETATNPGDVLTQLFNKYAPCLILIDEWVSYARQLRDDTTLPAGTIDTHFTFAHALSESAKAAKRTLLVVSVPSSDIEIGGEWGHRALAGLKNNIGRVESSWRPASPDEGFEIVRRRLFQPLTGDQFIARDAVARAFSELYGQQHQEFPSECREANYERRIKMAYPIHPELFDRLYTDWSTLDKFQRTRGVLRLMAAVIHSLWERQDSNLLIMPATVPVDDFSVQHELTRYMEDQWVPVIEKDVDGSNSLPLALDRENPNLGRYSAARRVARTIYMGSAPIQKAANRGIEDRQVKLGCVQPGETVATFGDALRRLTDRATYLYVDGKRYWYSTQPTVSRLAEDRATQLDDDAVTDEIVRRLREEAKARGDFAKVHACVASGDVPDEKEARLVIIGPEHPHTAKDASSAARREAAQILECRGTSPRNYKNAIVFLAPDATRLRELRQAVSQFLAWDSIWDDRVTLNLDQFQMKQAETKRKNSDETVDARIPETFQWLIVPGQSDPKGEVEWTEIRLQGQDRLAARASKKLKNEELLMVQLGDVRLRHELDRVPLWRGDHVGVKQLTEDVAKYLYLPRLSNENVLIDAIREGVARITWYSETFAYAAGWDDQKKRYKGLSGGRSITVLLDASSLVVKPEVAEAQLEAEKKKPEPPEGNGKGKGNGNGGGGGGVTVVHKKGDGETDGGDGGDGGVVVEPPQLCRFHGSAKLDPQRVGRDAAKIAEEIVQHLTSMIGAEVEVALEIQAHIPDGASTELVRTITENCRTLKFTDHGFEEE